MEPLFCIIVPVYNASDTIARCVECIQAQTVQDWELILVNDGSKDDSGAKCHQFAEADPRIIVIDKENGGPSSARNAGMRACTGDWMLFVDSDDKIDPETLSHLKGKINEGADLIIPDTVIEFPGGGQGRMTHREAVIDRKEFERLFTEYDLGHRSSIGGKCFRRSIIRGNKLSFNEQMHHAEDLTLIYDYLVLCQKVGFTGTPDYHYYFGNPNSLTQKFYSFEKEYAGYRQIRQSVEDTVKALGITGVDAVDNMSRPVVTGMTRSLNAIYHSELESSGRKRRGMIRMLDLDYYRDHAPITHNRKFRLLNFILLRMRCIWLYDLIRIIKARHR